MDQKVKVLQHALLSGGYAGNMMQAASAAATFIGPGRTSNERCDASVRKIHHETASLEDPCSARGFLELLTLAAGFEKKNGCSSGGVQGFCARFQSN
jgi:hypothetical protein